MTNDDLKWLTTTLDCGDNSCLFKDPNSGGMRTNGGCYCFKDLPPEKRMFIHKMFQTLLKIKPRPLKANPVTLEIK